MNRGSAKRVGSRVPAGTLDVITRRLQIPAGIYVGPYPLNGGFRLCVALI